ncbi:MAG: DUF3108 domain-containing protein [Candidatus Omnitrophica bacterium]|nr:DUF3108 domain-containing protein [Candidatus Omnitrophota bacterium]
MRLLNVFLTVFLVCVPAFAQEVKLPFTKGEVITYSIKKLAVKAGEATLTFEGETQVKDQKVYLIVFKADGFNFYDEEKIYVSIDTFAPVQVLRDLNIFGNKEKITEDYLSREGKIVITKTADGKTTQSTINKDGQIDNIYGVIYRYRASGKFQIGDEIQLRLPTKDISLKLQKSVSIKAAGQVYPSFFMSSVPSQYQIWFDAGDKKIPLRINGAVGMANTVMTMKSFSEGGK